MQLGTYLTSFLRVYINTNLPLDNIKAGSLTDYEKRVFIHEYTHFLQNITSGFGLLHAWNTYDRIRQHVADIQKQAAGYTQIPLTGAIAEEQEILLRIRKRMEGNYRIKEGVNDSTAKITKVRFEVDKDIIKLYPDRPPVYHLMLSLEDNEQRTAEYAFGEAAVSETMALLMESKYFETDPAPIFPYHVCKLLAHNIGTKLTDNDEILFAICDVSLMSGYPGIMFYKILLDMHQKDFLPACAEEAFDYGMKFMYNNGWRVWEDYYTQMQGTMQVFSSLLNHSNFAPTREWVLYLLERGYHFRLNDPHFMIKLFREPTPFEGFWNTIIAQFGTPELHNNSHVRSFSAPLDLKHSEDKIEAFILLALNEVQETLFKGKTECGLFDFCKKSGNGLKVDERCLTMPWKRAEDDPTCAYGGLCIALQLKLQ